MDESKYKAGEKMTDLARWTIETFTNLDPNSLSPFQETMVQFGAMSMLLLIIILIFK